MNLLCKIGIHSYEKIHREEIDAGWFEHVKCQRCRKHRVKSHFASICLNVRDGISHGTEMGTKIGWYIGLWNWKHPDDRIEEYK
jgi:hypothetical protein